MLTWTHTNTVKEPSTQSTTSQWKGRYREGRTCEGHSRPSGTQTGWWWKSCSDLYSGQRPPVPIGLPYKSSSPKCKGNLVSRGNEVTGNWRYLKQKIYRCLMHQGESKRTTVQQVNRQPQICLPVKGCIWGPACANCLTQMSSYYWMVVKCTG